MKLVATLLQMINLPEDYHAIIAIATKSTVGKAC